MQIQSHYFTVFRSINKKKIISDTNSNKLTTVVVVGKKKANWEKIKTNQSMERNETFYIIAVVRDNYSQSQRF